MLDKPLPQDFTSKERRNKRFWPIVTGLGAVAAAVVALNPFAMKDAPEPKDPSFSDKIAAYAQNPNENDTTISCPIKLGKGVIRSTADCINNTGILEYPFTFDAQGNLSGGPGPDAGKSLIVSGNNAQKQVEKSGALIQPDGIIIVKLPELNGEYVTPIVTGVNHKT